MARVVSRRSLTAESRVCAPVSPYGICGGQTGTGTLFPIPLVPSPVSFHRGCQSSHIMSSGGLTVGPLAAADKRIKLVSRHRHEQWQKQLINSFENVTMSTYFLNDDNNPELHSRRNKTTLISDSACYLSSPALRYPVIFKGVKHRYREQNCNFTRYVVWV
jgi:hypothetical protein